MATPSKADGLFFIIDPSSNQEKVVETISTILRRRLFWRPCDLINIFVINGQEPITVGQRRCRTNAELIKKLPELIENAKSNSDKKTDVSLALYHVLKIYVADYIADVKKSLQNVQVILFSDLKNTEISNVALKKCVDKYVPHPVRLYILGPDITVPLYTRNVSELQQSMFQSLQDRPEFNSKLIELIRKTSGAAVTMEAGKHLIESYKAAVGGPVTWRTKMTIGKNIAIQINGYRYTLSYAEPKYAFATPDFKQVKTRLVPSDEIPAKKIKQEVESDVKQEVVNDVKAGPSNQEDSQGELKDVHWHPDGSRILLSKEEKAAYKLKTARCLDILFTVKRDDINSTYFIGDSVTLVFANDVDWSSAVMFNAFVNSLKKCNLVAIARRCYNSNNNPKLAACYPSEYNGFKCLAISEAPFKEHIKYPLEFYNSTMKVWAEKVPNISNRDPEIKECVNKFLDACTLQEDDRLEHVPPRFQFSPKLDIVYRFLHKKFTSTEIGSDDLDFSPHMIPPVVEQRYAKYASKLIDLI